MHMAANANANDLIGALCGTFANISTKTLLVGEPAPPPNLLITTAAQSLARPACTPSRKRVATFSFCSVRGVTKNHPSGKHQSHNQRAARGLAIEGTPRRTWSALRRLLVGRRIPPP